MNVAMQDTATMMIVVGILLLLIEATAFGFSLVILAAVGLASIGVGVMIKLQWLSDSLPVALGVTSVFTAVIFAVVWRPLKKLGAAVDDSVPRSDLIGYTFQLDNRLTADEAHIHRYSGIDWLLECDENLDAATLVKVIEVDVGKFRVSPVAS